MAVRAVSSIVCSALRAQRALTGSESLLLAVSAGTTAMAAAIAEGADPTEVQTILVGGLVAVLAAISWEMERRPDAATVARAMDRRFGRSGAVLTAYQAESKHPTSPIAELLTREVALAISLKRFVAEAARSSAFVLAAPFASLALWSLATEVAGHPRSEVANASGPIVPGVSAGSRVRAKAARLAATPGIPADVAGSLRALAAEAEGLEFRAQSSSASDPNPLERERQLARRLEALQRRVREEGVTLSPPKGTMEGPDRRNERAPGTAMQDTRPETPAPASQLGATPGASTQLPVAERAVLGTRWWPARLDAVVERWIEARRTERYGRPPR